MLEVSDLTNRITQNIMGKYKATLLPKPGKASSHIYVKIEAPNPGVARDQLLAQYGSNYTIGSVVVDS